jgi:hypothetical protein
LTFYFPTLISDWSKLNYSEYDTNLIFSTFFKVLVELEKSIRPFADTSLLFKDLEYEFVDHRNLELVEAGALALAWRDKNLVYVEPGQSFFQMQATSAVMAMELAHSAWNRLFYHEDRKAWNDIIHFLYNDGRLFVRDYVTEKNLQRFGQSIKVVVPDMAYGIQNRKEIMAGIRSGAIKEGFNEYWADPALNKESDKVPAHTHERDMVAHWLSHGAVYGQKVEHH